MNPKLAVAAVVGTLAAIAIGVALTSDSKDVKPLGDAVDAGLVRQASTYAVAKQDGTTAYVSVIQDAAGKEVATYVDHSPCRRRPKGVPVALCSRVCGVVMGVAEKSPCDSGDENAMGAGQWIDNGGCEEAACAVVFGAERFK